MIKLIIKVFNKRYFIDMKNYIECKITSDCFVKLYLFDKRYKRLINYYIKHDFYASPIDDSFDDELKEKKDDCHVLLHLQNMIHHCLDYFGINHTINTFELKLWKKWFDYIPHFLDPTYELVCELEKLDKSRSHTKKWYRNYFLQTYKCKKFPPSWLQWCEWPMDDDGRPCLFLYQTGFPNRCDFIEYHFRKSNGEEIVIEQYV